jgi:predicted nucleotidyltransferase
MGGISHHERAIRDAEIARIRRVLALRGMLTEGRGFRRLGVFGSVARGEDRPDSDLDFPVESPEGADLSDLLHPDQAFTAILGGDFEGQKTAGVLGSGQSGVPNKEPGWPR